MEHIITLIPLFFLTALLYSQVGFGGGSTYLALLVLFNLPHFIFPQVALICNIVVVIGALYHHGKAGHLKTGCTLPFVLLSIPSAFLGGLITVSRSVFLFLLALSLAAAGLRLLFINQKNDVDSMNTNQSWVVGLPVGAALGFLSGLVGIGGGIFLAPILYFIRWGHAREIAALSSFFIFVNSISSLAGQIFKSGFVPDISLILPLVLSVLIGGQIGSRLSVSKIPLLGLQKITAVLILSVSFRIGWTLI